jgi:lysine 2,3-aminomutase
LNTAPKSGIKQSTPNSPNVTTRNRLRSSIITESVDEKVCDAIDQEEPPGKGSTGREYFFPGVPDFLWNDWKWHFRNRITSIEQLSRFIPISFEEKLRLETVTKRYPMAITPYYLSLINPDDPDDPIRKQAVPSVLEIALDSMGMEDPLGEKEDSVVPGLVHRYPDRVLMVITDICPMLCRHCTRKREWRHGAWTRTDTEIERMFDYIRSNSAIRDVIISGGDPLTLSNQQLEHIISKLREIKHVEIIRIGSRFPVVLPQRINAELCAILSKYGPIWLNTHFNHPNELTPEAIEACDRILRCGVPVNNQSVLLRGINDSVEIMTRLCHRLLKAKVRPYYLFQCDEVQGTEHLRTPVEVGVKIIEGMRGHTSGLAVPTFVVDLVQGGGKVPLQPNYVLSMDDKELLLRNYEGQVYRYRNPNPESAREMVKTAQPVSDIVESLLTEPVKVAMRKRRN